MPISIPLDMGNTPLLDEIEARARRERVPIIRREMQSFLKTLLAMKRPMRILEVGRRRWVFLLCCSASTARRDAG